MNDRPYTANSFLSVAIGEMFSTAMGGRSKERQELAETAIPLTATLPVVACRGGIGLLEKLFGPLGYAVKATDGLLDEQFPEWGASAYFSVEIAATTPTAGPAVPSVCARSCSRQRETLLGR